MNHVLAIKDPAGSAGRPLRAPRRPGCARVGGITVLFLACASDLVLQAQAGGSPWPPALALAVGMAALLWPVRLRPEWLTPQVRTSVPALAAAANILLLVVQRQEGWSVLGQVALLLCLLLVAVRTCSPGWALVCGVLDGGTALAVALPHILLEPGDGSGYGLLTVILLLVACTAGLGAYLRTLDNRRYQAVTETRRAERLAMAADLHDFVAHHVTGILVQAQVARMMSAAGAGPKLSQDEARARLDTVLAGIESAATEALSSMRRTVGVLREHDDSAEPAERRPAGDLAAITELVGAFGGVGGLDAHHPVLDRDPSVPDELPHEVQTAAFRVVQEALTNVRRHAADATEVTVGLRYADTVLEVAVRDNGRGSLHLPEAARGGGFGLVGLFERVTALGGRLQAGLREEGHGWEVVAQLPTGPLAAVIQRSVLDPVPRRCARWWVRDGDLQAGQAHRR